LGEISTFWEKRFIPNISNVRAKLWKLESKIYGSRKITFFPEYLALNNGSFLNIFGTFPKKILVFLDCTFQAQTSAVQPVCLSVTFWKMKVIFFERLPTAIRLSLSWLTDNDSMSGNWVFVEWQNVEQQNIEWQNFKQQNVKQQNVKWLNVEWLNVEQQNVEQQNVKWHNVEQHNVEQQNVKQQNVKIQIADIRM
jgi:hypothetical protein